ncbi:MAG: polysaccharide deacetylase family protein, partial [Pirellulaceae bacterium]
MISTSDLRKMLLPAYYYGTLLGRRFAMSLAARRGLCPIAVLFYHRVADHTPNPWTVSHWDFERQVTWLARHFEVISLAEAQCRMEKRASYRPAACLTFDDGYAENCERALPWLCERKLPVTYFVASQFVLRGRPFPHDVERGEPLPVNTVKELRWLASQGVEIGAHTRSHRDLGRVQDRDELRDEIEGSRHDLQEAIGVPIRYFA